MENSVEMFVRSCEPRHFTLTLNDILSLPSSYIFYCNRYSYLGLLFMYFLFMYKVHV